MTCEMRTWGNYNTYMQVDSVRWRGALNRLELNKPRQPCRKPGTGLGRAACCVLLDSSSSIHSVLMKLVCAKGPAIPTHYSAYTSRAKCRRYNAPKVLFLCCTQRARSAATDTKTPEFMSVAVCCAVVCRVQPRNRRPN